MYAIRSYYGEVPERVEAASHPSPARSSAASLHAGYIYRIRSLKPPREGEDCLSTGEWVRAAEDERAFRATRGLFEHG